MYDTKERIILPGKKRGSVVYYLRKYEICENRGRLGNTEEGDEGQERRSKQRLFTCTSSSTKSLCEVPLRFTPGWHSGDARVCLGAVHGATELRVFTVVACAAGNRGGVL